MGEGVFEPGNPEGRGAQAVLEIQVERGWGGQKTVPSITGVWTFSGITQYWQLGTTGNSHPWRSSTVFYNNRDFTHRLLESYGR